MAIPVRKRVELTLDGSGEGATTVGPITGWLAHVDVVTGLESTITLYDEETDVVYAAMVAEAGGRYSPRGGLIDIDGVAIAGGNTPMFLLGATIGVTIAGGTALDIVAFDVIVIP